MSCHAAVEWTRQLLTTLRCVQVQRSPETWGYSLMSLGASESDQQEKAEGSISSVGVSLHLPVAASSQTAFINWEAAMSALPNRGGSGGGSPAGDVCREADRRGIIKIMASVKHPVLPPLPPPSPLSIQYIPLARSLACLPSWGLGYHGNQRNALLCGWLRYALALDLHGPSAQPEGGCSPEPLNNDWETTPHLSLSPSTSLSLSRSPSVARWLRPLLPAALCEVVRLKLRTTSESPPPEWVITGRRTIFIFRAAANVSLSARLSTASPHRTHSARDGPHRCFSTQPEESRDGRNCRQTSDNSVPRLLLLLKNVCFHTEAQGGMYVRVATARMKADSNRRCS